MEFNIDEVDDISILRKLYTTLEEKLAKVVEDLEIERVKVAKLEAELSKYSENSAGDGQQIVAQSADPNPLLLKTVLHQMSGYLDHKAQASGRLVCHKWKNIITPGFQKMSKMTLDFTSYVDKEIDNMALILSSAFPDSENEERIRIPSCVNLTFQTSKDHRGTCMLLNRLKTLGKCIKELTLNMNITFSRCAQDLFLDILNSCNNLESLIIPRPAIEPLDSNVLFPYIKSLQIGEEREDDIEAYSIPVINSILRSTPNLSTLRLSILNTEGDILSCFATCRNAGFLENLVELVLWCSFVTTESLTTLSQCQFKCLKTLTLEAYDVDADGTLPLDFQASAVLTTLLVNLSPSLENLTLGMKIPNEEEADLISLTISSIPRMECLKSFSFTDEMNTEQGSIDGLMDKFPKLETLSLGHCWENVFEDVRVADRLFPEHLAGESQYFTLRKLWIPNLPIKYYETREYYSPLEIIARSCPEIESLKLGFNFHQVNSKDKAGYFKTAISELSLLLQLSELSIVFKGVSKSDFNNCVSGMFEDKFHGLKSLSFLNFDDNCKINLEKETVKKGFGNAPSLVDLTFRYFSIKANEKQEIFQTLSKIKRVCFRKCSSFEKVPIDSDFARASLPSTNKIETDTEDEDSCSFEFGVSTGLDLGY